MEPDREPPYPILSPRLRDVDSAGNRLKSRTIAAGNPRLGLPAKNVKLLSDPSGFCTGKTLGLPHGIAVSKMVNKPLPTLVSAPCLLTNLLKMHLFPRAESFPAFHRRTQDVVQREMFVTSA